MSSKELQDIEENEKLEELQRNKELMLFRRGQKEEKDEVKMREFKHEQKMATRAQAMVDQQDEQFYSYAERCIKEWKDQGKNVTPLILELKNMGKDNI
mgnify:CR=1 FL=1